MESIDKDKNTTFSFRNSSTDACCICTKQTSNISYTFTDNISFSNNLNLSYNFQTTNEQTSTLSKKLIQELPQAKRSKSHKRHHFKATIDNTVNEELNEDDSDIISCDNDCTIVKEMSPKTKNLIHNLLVNTNIKSKKKKNNFIWEGKKLYYEQFEDELQNEDFDRGYMGMMDFDRDDSNSEFDEDNFGFDLLNQWDNKDNIKQYNGIIGDECYHDGLFKGEIVIPTIYGKILKLEAEMNGNSNICNNNNNNQL